MKTKKRKKKTLDRLSISPTYVISWYSDSIQSMEARLYGIGSWVGKGLTNETVQSEQDCRDCFGRTRFVYVLYLAAVSLQWRKVVRIIGIFNLVNLTLWIKPELMGSLHKPDDGEKEEDTWPL